MSTSKRRRAGQLTVEEPLPKKDRQARKILGVTDAELGAWEEEALRRNDEPGERILCLIDEVRRLYVALRGVDQSTAIVRDPERCAGDPIIEGTRTAVHDVVSYAHAFGGDLERVRDEALPHLSMKQVRAAMGYYAEHTEEIEEIFRQRDEDYARLPKAPYGVRTPRGALHPD